MPEGVKRTRLFHEILAKVLSIQNKLLGNCITKFLFGSLYYIKMNGLFEIYMVVFCQIRDFNSIYKVSGGTLVCTTVMSSRLETAGQIYTISKFDFPISFKNVREVKSGEQD